MWGSKAPRCALASPAAAAACPAALARPARGADRARCRAARRGGALAVATAPLAAPTPDPARRRAVPNATPNPGHSVSGHLLLVLAGRLSAAAARRRTARPGETGCRARRGRQFCVAPARPVAAAGRPAPLRLPREAGTASGGSNLRPVKEESQIERHEGGAPGRPRAGRAGPAALDGERAGAATRRPASEPGARAGTEPEPSSRRLFGLLDACSAGSATLNAWSGASGSGSCARAWCCPETPRDRGTSPAWSRTCRDSPLKGKQPAAAAAQLPPRRRAAISPRSAARGRTWRGCARSRR